MKHEWSGVVAGSRTAVSAIWFGVALGTIGCGGTPESLGTNDRGTGTIDTGGDGSQTAWAQKQYPAAWGVAQSYLAAEEQLSGRSISRVTALYHPDVEGPAYLEFGLRKGSEDAGHIIASTGAHDVPIVAWSAKGGGDVRALEIRHQRDFGDARIFMINPAIFVVELPDGSALSGTSPKTPETWTLAKEKVRRAHFARKAEFADRYVQEWRKFAKIGGSALPPDVLPACPVDGCGGDPCRAGQPGWPGCMGCQGYGAASARGADIFTDPNNTVAPNYVQFSGVFPDGSSTSRVVRRPPTISR